MGEGACSDRVEVPIDVIFVGSLRLELILATKRRR